MSKDKIDVFVLTDVAERLNEAQIAYEDAKQKESFARSAATTALNNLNDIQKEFDRIAESLRENAPWDSRWHEPDRQKRAVKVA